MGGQRLVIKRRQKVVIGVNRSEIEPQRKVAGETGVNQVGHREGVGLELPKFGEFHVYTIGLSAYEFYANLRSTKRATLHSFCTNPSFVSPDAGS